MLNFDWSPTGALSDVVKVERSLVGVPSVLVDLHCGLSQISLLRV